MPKVRNLILIILILAFCQVSSTAASVPDRATLFPVPRGARGIDRSAARRDGATHQEGDKTAILLNVEDQDRKLVAPQVHVAVASAVDGPQAIRSEATALNSKTPFSQSEIIMTQSTSSRREFFTRSSQAATALTLGLAAGSRTTAAENDKVRLGFIGVGNRGSQLLRSFMKNSDVKVVALCDVYEPYLARDRGAVDKQLLDDLGSRIPRMGEGFGSDVARYTDFRRLLDRNDIDAVVIATPDHWHAIQTIAAMNAGKDVYVEKPLSITIHEGRQMVEAAQRTGRVVQVGLHRRSSELYRNVHDLVQRGKIGKVTVARAFRVSNMYPDGIGHAGATRPVAGLHWDMWLGPRPEIKYQDNITPYKFRWWRAYSSQMGNWGVHYCDGIRWILEDEAPTFVSAHGGRFAIDDDRTIPDTMQATFELPSQALLIFGQYEASGGPAIIRGEIELRGTLANLYLGSEAREYAILPSNPGQFQTAGSPLKEEVVGRIDGDLTDQHTRNFLDCVKSRGQCNCDMETGHRSTTFAHLANIALQTRSCLQWDARNERITNNDEANALLHYEYRVPWKLG
jgi:predicted dehydrogenase